MQPAFEPRIVHVGLPPIEREDLAAADDCCQLVFSPDEVPGCECDVFHWSAPIAERPAAARNWHEQCMGGGKVVLPTL